MRTTACNLAMLALAPAWLAAQEAPPTASDLRLDPARPMAGEVIQVRYVAEASLARESVLRLRGRLRTSDDGPFEAARASTLAMLERGADGTFRGSFLLPADVVHATIAVEDTAGTIIDTQRGEFRELLVHDATGRPLLAALDQRLRDFMGRDTRQVLETARRTTELYPDNALGWVALDMAEGLSFGAVDSAGRKAQHRRRVIVLDSMLSEGKPSAQEVEALYFYAASVGNGEVARKSWAQLERAAPFHAAVANDRMMQLLRLHSARPDSLLLQLEQLAAQPWPRTALQRIASMGFAVARKAGDTAAALQWSARMLELDPRGARAVAAALARTPGTRAEGIRRLTAALAAPATDETRPLASTRADHARENAVQAARDQSVLGEALVQEARVQEALPHLEAAAAAGWSIERYRALGAARLSAGDTLGALAAHAAAAADPQLSDAAADSLRDQVHADAATWQAAVRAAVARMVRQTLELAVDEPLPDVHVATADGTSVRLARQFGTHGTVLVFWSRYCGYSQQAMPRIVELGARLARQGVPLLGITTDSPAAGMEYLAEGSYQLTALFDTHREAAQALRSWGTPEYYVLDGRGHLRFRSSLDELLRHVAALQEVEVR